MSPDTKQPESCREKHVAAIMDLVIRLTLDVGALASTHTALREGCEDADNVEAVRDAAAESEKESEAALRSALESAFAEYETALKAMLDKHACNRHRYCPGCTPARALLQGGAR